MTVYVRACKDHVWYSFVKGRENLIRCVVLEHHMIESPRAAMWRTVVRFFISKSPSLRTTMNVKCVKIKTIFFVFLANSPPAICASGFYVEYASLPTDPLQHEGRAVVVAAELKLYATTHQYGAGDGLLAGVLLRIERVDAIHCSRIQAA